MAMMLDHFQPKVDRGFWHGLSIALPISVLLWVGLYGLVRWILG